MPGTYGARDGWIGRSDTQQLRQHFEVSREHIALAAIKALADQGDLSLDVAQEALSKLGIDADKPNPMTV